MGWVSRVEEAVQSFAESIQESLRREAVAGSETKPNCARWRWQQADAKDSFSSLKAKFTTVPFNAGEGAGKVQKIMAG